MIVLEHVCAAYVALAANGVANCAQKVASTQPHWLGGDAVQIEHLAGQVVATLTVTVTFPRGIAATCPHASGANTAGT